MTSYEPGRNAEYRVKSLSKTMGYRYVIRPSASRTNIDLIGSNGNDIIAVQSSTVQGQRLLNLWEIKDY